MTREEAIKWMQEEKASFERAPDLNGCPMTECWQKAIDVYEMAISALRQQWISVKDRLPEQTDPAQKVLFITKTGGLFIGCYYKATAYDQFNGWYSMCVRIDNVTNWMPLPEPPEEGII